MLQKVIHAHSLTLVCYSEGTKCSLYKGTTLMQILSLVQAHTCTHDGPDTVQLVLVVFTFHQLESKYSTCTHGGHHLQLALVVFLGRRRRPYIVFSFRF